MRKFLKWIFILTMPVVIIFLILSNIVMLFKYENEKSSKKEIQELLSNYDGVSFIKYKPTLFTIYNRGGFEIDNNIDNLIYEKELDIGEIEEAGKAGKISEITVSKTENTVNISCRIDMKNYWYSMNDCLFVFSRITNERMKYLKQMELNNIHKHISYNYSGTDKSFWSIKIGRNRYYELKFSEIHRLRIQETYRVELPDKIYGILTENQFKKIEKFSFEKITTDDEEGLRELWDIFPFISFSYRYKDVIDTGKMN